MSTIKTASKIEQLRSVTFEQYQDTLQIARDDEGDVSITLAYTDPRPGALESLKAWAENTACSPEDIDNDPVFVKRASLIAEIDRRLEALKVTWGADRGQYEKRSFYLGITREDARVLRQLLEGSAISADVKSTVTSALADW